MSARSTSEQPALFLHLVIERRTRNGRVQHELVEIGLVRDGVLDLGGDVFGCVMFQPQNGGPQENDAVLAQFARQLQRVGAFQFGVSGLRRFQTQPDGRDAQFHQFLIAVLPDGVGRRKNIESPTLAGGLHARQQVHGALPLEQEVLVHDEERFHVAGGFRFLHQAEQFLAGGVEIEHFPLASEEGRRGAEIAAHGASHGSDDGGGSVRLIGDLHAHDAQVEAGGKGGMANGGRHVLAQVAAHPLDAIALHDVVGVEDVLDAGNRGHVPAHHDGGVRREFADHAAHLARLADVHDDRRYAHDVVRWAFNSRAKASRVGKSRTVQGAEIFS